MMKKLLIFAALALILTGCAGEEPPATEPTVETTVPAPTGLYEVGSPVETRTEAAIRSYRLPEDNCYRIAGVGERLLLFAGEEQTTLSLFTGDQCLPENQLALPIDLREGVWQLTDTGCAYYDHDQKQVVYLDSQLQPFHSVAVPEDMEGMPLISPACDEIFYCVGQEIRGLDTERGISRLIKSQSCDSLQLTGCFFDGRILSCRVKKGEQLSTVYLSTENGMTICAEDGITWLYSFEDRYLTYRMDGVTAQYITGLREESPAQLNVPADTVMLMDATALDGAVGCSVDEAGAMVLSFYDLITGQRTAMVATGEVAVPVGIWADRWSGCIWLLCQKDDSRALLRWNVAASPCSEEATYLGSVYTESSPDEAGLAALQERVDGLNKEHGTAIRIWQEAVKTPGSHGMKPEYQVPAIEEMLDQLEPILQLFPESFLRKSVNTKIRICIVRSVDGSTESVRYWDDGDAFVILPVGQEPKTGFLRAMSYIVDSHILGNSPMLDAWEGLNPEGFAYGAEAPEAYLKGESQAFAEVAATESVTDDRAAVFYYAMLPDSGELFKAPIMQSKLLLLCQSIRDAWRLERKTETYLWEQYLTESIAYVQ